MIQSIMRNDSPIENLPYEMFEEITEKIFPKNISPNEIPAAFQAIKALSQTNKKMRSFVNSSRINNPIIGLIIKNCVKLDIGFIRKFLSWYIFNNRLDRIFNEIHNIQTTILSVLSRVTHVFGESMSTVNYQNYNFALHQVGEDVMQPKTCLVISSDHRDIEVLYPFGKVKIHHYGSELPENVRLSMAEDLITGLNAPFQGLFEKHHRRKINLFRRMYQLDSFVTLGNSKRDVLEFVENRNLDSSYFALTHRDAEGTFRITNLVGLREMEEKKGKKELVFSRTPHLFSCYRIHNMFEDFFYRNRGNSEMDLLARMFSVWCENAPVFSRSVRSGGGCTSPFLPIEECLDIITCCIRRDRHGGFYQEYLIGRIRSSLGLPLPEEDY